jgi:ABC-type lipoprotein export system ATPase subunit
MNCKIRSISISNSEFFEDPLSFEFSEGLNCLMGGRGTGKSTLLYFIKACITADAEELDRTLSSLLKTNLNNGKVTLLLESGNGDQILVEKTFGDEPLVTRAQTGETMSIRSLEEHFQCDIYPALYIEEIGKSSRDRLDLIEKPILGEVREIKSGIKALQITLRKNAQAIRAENAMLVEHKGRLIEYGSATTDLKNWKEAKPAAFSADEQKEFETADEKEKIRHSEARYLKNSVKKLQGLMTSLDLLNDEIGSTAKLGEQRDFINRSITDEIALEIKTVTGSLAKSANALRAAVSASVDKILSFDGRLSELHGQQQSEFIRLKQKFDQHREYINQYNRFGQRVEERKVLISEIKDLEERIAKLYTQRHTLIVDLNSKKKDIFNTRKEAVDKLNVSLGGNVKVTLTFGGITDEYETLLRNALKGSNLRYNTIIPYIVESFTPDQFAAIVHQGDANELKKISEIDVERSDALLAALRDKEQIYEIEALYVDDLPEFFLKVEERNNVDNTRRENFKRSDDLSTGQRCTAVLPIVFAVSDNPLIIDQPEDNLDNEFINDTVRKIVHDQKKNRQLIFITHNPNIPVVSDAEFNLFLHYEAKHSHVLNSGSVEDVKDNILDLLEGGRDAFNKRRELYDHD